MSASEIIQEIQRLPATERQKVLTALDRRLSPEELGTLAERMVNAHDPAEQQALAEELERGWSGTKAHAWTPAEDLPRSWCPAGRPSGSRLPGVVQNS